MNGHYTLKEFFSYLTGRLLLFVVIVALVTGGSLFYGHRHSATAGTESYSFKNSDFTVSELLSFDNNARIEGSDQLCDYGKFWVRNPLLADFAVTLNARYDMQLIDNTWNTLSESDQLDWIRDKFKVSTVNGEPYYEVNLKLAANAANYDYLKQHVVDILDAYNTYVEDTIRSYFPQSSMTVSKYDHFDLDIATKQTTSSGHSLIWYAALGIFGGVLIGLLVLFLLFTTSRKVVSFQTIATRYNVPVYHMASEHERSLFLHRLAASGTVPVAAIVLSLGVNRTPVSSLLAEELQDSGFSFSEISPEPDSVWYDPFSAKSSISAQKKALLFFNEERFETKTIPLLLASQAVVVEADNTTLKKSLTGLLSELKSCRLNTEIYLII